MAWARNFDLQPLFLQALFGSGGVSEPSGAHAWFGPGRLGCSPLEHEGGVPHQPSSPRGEMTGLAFPHQGRVCRLRRRGPGHGASD